MPAFERNTVKKPLFVDPDDTGPAGVTLIRQDIVLDILKIEERKIAPVEAKTRPSESVNNSQPGQSAEDLPAHPMLIDKAYFSGAQDESVLPSESPEAREAAKELQHELSQKLRLQRQFESSMSPSPGR